MAAQLNLILITAEELLQMPDTEKHTELVNGEIVRMAPAGEEHGELAGSTYGLLFQFVRRHKLGKVYAAETGFVLSRNPDTVRAPDVAFVSAGRLKSKPGAAFFEGPPDLAVEVVSPSETEGDVKAKIQDYLRAGTKLIWIIRPRTQTIIIHRPHVEPRVLTLGDTLDGEDVVPGFAVPVRDIFEWEL
jgi:Uma2 family endonuclease